jgi:hypothetical protein
VGSYRICQVVTLWHCSKLTTLHKLSAQFELNIESFPNVFQQNLLTAAVVEFRRSAVGVAGDSLSGFQGAVMLQKIRDPRRPK